MNGESPQERQVVRDCMSVNFPIISVVVILEGMQVDHLVVVTWNVMFDYYDSEKIHTDLRNPLLLKALARTKADIIGLQVHPLSLNLAHSTPCRRSPILSGKSFWRRSGSARITIFLMDLPLQPSNPMARLFSLGSLSASTPSPSPPPPHIPN